MLLKSVYTENIIRSRLDESCIVDNFNHTKLFLQNVKLLFYLNRI
jgi:hypothetical protein